MENQYNEYTNPNSLELANRGLPATEMSTPLTFGEWFKSRRKALDLTQAELARRASCTVFMLRKIEANERRPSKQLAGLLAQALDIPSEDQTTFVRVARGELNIDLGKLMLAIDRVDQAEKYLQESNNLLSGFGESDDLAYGLLHLGKCFLARSDAEAARQVFHQVIKIGQGLNMAYLVYWGWVNVARVFMSEGCKEKALRILLVLGGCPIEYKEAQDEGDHLLADLRAELPKERVEIITKQVNARISQDPAGIAGLAYALEFTAK